jgi:hypothetical protein
LNDAQESDFDRAVKMIETEKKRLQIKKMADKFTIWKGSGCMKNGQINGTQVRSRSFYQPL